jgi:hypothetical protein
VLASREARSSRAAERKAAGSVHDRIPTFEFRDQVLHGVTECERQIEGAPKMTAQVAAALKQEGWQIKEDSLAKILGSLGTNGRPQLGDVQAALKDSNLKEIGVASLPDDVNRATNKHLEGTRVLQVRDRR